jgi:linearmycin/streptolysin S transport system permease protein
MAKMKPMWFMMVKDLKIFATDRLALFFFLLFPFIFVVAFYFMLGSVGTQDERLTLHVTTEEAAGGLSYQVLSQIETKDVSSLNPGQPEIIWDRDYKQLLQQVTDKKLSGFLSFPADFTQGVMMGYGTHIQVIVDPTATTTRAALSGLASSIAAQTGAQQVASNAAVGLVVEQALASGDVSSLGSEIQTIFMSPATPAVSLISFDTQKVGEVEAGNPANYVIPGYLVMFTFFAAAQSASVIVRERQNNTMERLLATSATRETILGGMFAGTVVKGLIQVFIFWAIGVLAFKIDMGASPLAVIIVSLLMVLVSASFSIMLATFARTERGAGSLGVLVSLVLAPLGGCWWPLFVTPKWMQFIAKLIPHGWANSAFNSLMVFGGDFNSAVSGMLALAAFAIVFATIAVARFRTDAV